jgi:hypothetical protein
MKKEGCKKSEYEYIIVTKTEKGQKNEMIKDLPELKKRGAELQKARIAYNVYNLKACKNGKKNRM